MQSGSTLKRYWSWAMALTVAMSVGLVVAQSSHDRTQLPPPYATPSVANFSKVIGWPAGTAPRAPEGFVVEAIATDLESPRWLYVLPNGDVLVSQARTERLAK